MVAGPGKTREDTSNARVEKAEKPKRGYGSAMIFVVLVLVLGLGVGTLGGLLGTSGGIVLVPALVYLFHMDQHLAQGTSLFILLPPVGLGALREYWKGGNVDLHAGILCASGILLGGYLGGLIAVPLSSRELKGFFGGFLMVAALLLLRKSQPLDSPAVHAENGDASA